jgi:hypothetical protein
MTQKVPWRAIHSNAFIANQNKIAMDKGRSICNADCSCTHSSSASGALCNGPINISGHDLPSPHLSVPAADFGSQVNIDQATDSPPNDRISAWQI